MTWEAEPDGFDDPETLAYVAALFAEALKRAAAAEGESPAA